jgi:intergrase/recombinase
MEPTVNVTKEAWRAFHCFTIKIKKEDLPTLNQRLNLYGYGTMTELTKDFILGKFPIITEDRQIQSLEANTQANGLKTAIVNGPFEPSFYKDTNLDDMLTYLLNIRKLQEHNARSLVSYFHRFADVFFGPNPTQISKLTPHKRMWIMQAMRNFGGYYFYKTNNPECKELIEKIISRFGLNIGWDRQKKIYLVDENFVEEKLKLLMQVQGEIGLAIRIGLFTGLREDEVVYIHSTEICNNKGGCTCQKLHVTNKSNGLTVVLINWVRGHKKCYFTILPTMLWQQFRNLKSFTDADIDIAHKMTKKFGIKFMDLRKIHYNVMCRAMQENEADILVGRAKTVSARHYVLYELDKMAENYRDAWRRCQIGENLNKFDPDFGAL